MPFRPGEKLINKYEIERMLGQGGFGYAYLARHLDLGGVYRVIKELKREVIAEEGVQQRFENEAQIMANLNHPNIVVIHDFLKPPATNNYCIVMEYLSGGSLDQWLDRAHGRRLPITQAVKIAIDVCRGLEQAHRREIVHRDIKPPNILLSKNGDIVKVSDWGIAHLPEANLTLGGQPGTLTYMSAEQAHANISVEQARGDSKIDGRSDLYTVGVMLFEMVTGEFYLDLRQVLEDASASFRRRHRLSPSDELNRKLEHDLQWVKQEAICQAIVERQPRRPDAYHPGVPRALEEVILKALAKDPRDRYQTAAEMIQALEQLPTVARLIEQAQRASQKLDFEQALQLLQQARATAPNDPQVYSEMAILYNLTGRHTEALEILAEGARLNAPDAALFKIQGMTYLKIGQDRKAVEALKRSLDLDPNQSQLRNLVKKLR